MQAVNSPFVSVIDGTKQFIIPTFQRDYSWTVEQCDQMWSDIVRAGSEADNEHFMGAFVYVAGNTAAVFSSWMVIDGQQRLTTLTLLLIALRDHIQESKWKGEEPTPEQIDAYFLKNEKESGNRRYKLALRRHDNETLRALVDCKSLSDLGSSSQLIVEAYDHFRELLNSSKVDPEKIYQGIASLKVVDVTLHRPMDNPQRVFESLNSTGVDLTQSDLIRNYLLMGLPEPEQSRMYDDYWSKVETAFRTSKSAPDTFLRDYIALKQKTTTQARADRIYVEFKNFWQPSDTESLGSLLEDLVRFARYYVAFLRPERIDVKPLATEMRQARNLGSAHAIVVMRLYECYEKGTLSLDEFIRALKLISSYLVRRAVLGMQTRDYWSVFARVAYSIDDQYPFESFQVAIARQSYRFPTDSEFMSSLQERDLYGLRICWHILSQLENAGQSEPSPVADYSIEHIMPQSIDNVPQWKSMLGDGWEATHQTRLHRLGNLTLTAYNSAYSNRPFKEKKTIEGGFEQSAVRLNKYVRDQSQWTASEIDERGRELSRRAVHIWQHHNTDEKLLLAAAIRELHVQAANRNPDDLSMNASTREILYAIRDSIRELGEAIEIVERRSLCYYDAHSANFFVETLPMSGYVRVLLPIDFDEVNDPAEMAGDVTAWKFLPNVTHRDCGVFIDVGQKDQIPTAVAIIRQAFNVAKE